ncbi:MAG: hypothetical protein ABSG42_02695 [Nitrospirota bacterium]
MGTGDVNGSNHCFRCGKGFPEGGLRYRVDIRVSADTGVELTVEDLDKELGRLIKVMEGKSSSELEREVHTDFKFYLCRECKEEYLKGPDIPLDRFFFGE